VIAGDISPIDVITHVPILCEEAGVPYIYVHSKEELGAAGQTKRPTSCMLVGPRNIPRVYSCDHLERDASAWKRRHQASALAPVPVTTQVSFRGCGFSPETIPVIPSRGLPRPRRCVR
jgi:hypothetical protein